MMTTQNLSIRRDDQVQVMTGKERGKIGKVVKVDRKSGAITIEKVNMVKRHVRPSQQYPQGGILEKEAPLHYSNVLLYCAKCNRGVRHGKKTVEKTAKKGSKGAAAAAKMVKARVCKRCGETLDRV